MQLSGFHMVVLSPPVSSHLCSSQAHLLIIIAGDEGKGLKPAASRNDTVLYAWSPYTGPGNGHHPVMVHLHMGLWAAQRRVFIRCAGVTPKKE